MATSFMARYEGFCELCDQEIQEGDECAYHDDVVVHYECKLEEI